MIVGLSESFMKEMVSPSAVGAAAAMAKVDPGVIAMTMIETRVAAAMVYLTQILSRCHCLHQQMIIVKRTKGLSRATRFCRLHPGWSSSSFI
jgi:hypothetical protein